MSITTALDLAVKPTNINLKGRGKPIIDVRDLNIPKGRTYEGPVRGIMVDMKYSETTNCEFIQPHCSFILTDRIDKNKTYYISIYWRDQELMDNVRHIWDYEDNKEIVVLFFGGIDDHNQVFTEINDIFTVKDYFEMFIEEQKM